MSDVPDQPHPLTPDECEAIKNDLRRGSLSPNQAWRLVATVEALRTELADAHTVIRRYEAGWHSTKHVEGLWAKDSLRFEQWEPMTPGEVDAIRRARATTEGVGQ